MTVAATASILTQQGYKVLIIDLDAQRNLDMVAGDGETPLEIPRNNIEILSALHVLKGQCSLKEAVIESSIGDLVRASNALYSWRGNHVLSGEKFKRAKKNIEALLDLSADSSQSTSNSDIQSYLQQTHALFVDECSFQEDIEDYRLLEYALEEVKEEYDYILIDTNPSLTTLTLNALYACEYVIIPTFPESSAIEAVLELNDTIQTIKSAEPFRKLEIAGVLMTKYSPFRKKSQRHEEILKEVTEHMLHTYLFHTKIRDTEKASAYVEACMDVIRYDPQGNTSLDYQSFVSELKLRLASMGGSRDV